MYSESLVIFQLIIWKNVKERSFSSSKCLTQSREEENDAASGELRFLYSLCFPSERPTSLPLLAPCPFSSVTAKRTSRSPTVNPLLPMEEVALSSTLTLSHTGSGSVWPERRCVMRLRGESCIPADSCFCWHTELYTN